MGPIDLSQLREWLLVAGATLVWFVRLEGKVSEQKALSTVRLQGLLEENMRINAAIAQLRKNHEELESRVLSKLSELGESLARIEGFLEVNKDDQSHRLR